MNENINRSNIFVQTIRKPDKYNLNVVELL